MQRLLIEDAVSYIAQENWGLLRTGSGVIPKVFSAGGVIVSSSRAEQFRRLSILGMAYWMGLLSKQPLTSLQKELN